MPRIRVTMFAASLVVAWMAWNSAIQAQAPGQQGGQGGQGGPGGRGGFRGGPGRTSALGLLASPEVQKELNLTDDQKKQLDDLRNQLDQQQNQQRPQFGRGGNNVGGGFGPGGNNDFGGGFDPVARQQARAAMQEARAARDAQTSTALAKILTPDQRKRLSEIRLQQIGPLAVATIPEIQQKLNMSPEQIAQVQAIVDQMGEERRQAMQNNFAMFRQFREQGLDPAAIREQMNSPQFKAQRDQMKKQADSLEQQTIQQIARVLTSRQKQVFNAMLGEPFKLEDQTGPGGPDATPNTSPDPGKDGSASTATKTTRGRRTRGGSGQ